MASEDWSDGCDDGPRKLVDSITDLSAQAIALIADGAASAAAAGGMAIDMDETEGQLVHRSDDDDAGPGDVPGKINTSLGDKADYERLRL